MVWPQIVYASACYTVKVTQKGKWITIVTSTATLIAQLQDSDRAAAITAAAALARIGGPEAVNALESALQNHPELAVRVASADALGQIGGLEAAMALARMLNDGDPVVWRAAAEALHALDRDAMPAVVELLQSAQMDQRMAALRAALWLTVPYDDPEASVSNIELFDAWGWWN